MIKELKFIVFLFISIFLVLLIFLRNAPIVSAGCWCEYSDGYYGDPPTGHGTLICHGDTCGGVPAPCTGAGCWCACGFTDAGGESRSEQDVVCNARPYPPTCWCSHSKLNASRTCNYGYKLSSWKLTTLCYGDYMFDGIYLTKGACCKDHCKKCKNNKSGDCDEHCTCTKWTPYERHCIRDYSVPIEYEQGFCGVPPACDPNVWGAWSTCTATCDGGTTSRTNACGTVQTSTCNTQPCNYVWWQVKDGDVTTNSNISSTVPVAQLFDTIGNGGFPGVPVYGTSLSVGTGAISATNWNANTITTQSRLFDYSYFKNLVPDDVVSDSVYSDGYKWTMITGDYTMPATNFGTEKVILFVDGNLTINGNISLTDNQGFFAVFVNGSINVNPAVNSLEGIYLADDGFSTGVGTSQLRVRGSIASYGGINLERDLTDNTSPAELFEYAPDQVVLFPDKLGFRRTKWAEVAP